MELKDVMINRRSVRKYHDQPISDEVLTDIFETALWAPSSVNLQPWYFVVVRSPEERKKLAGILALSKERIRPKIEERFQNNPEVVKDTLTFMESMGGAPVCVLVFSYTQYQEDLQASVALSVAAAMQNLMLAAYDKGIGTCWNTGSAKEIEEAYGQNKGQYVGTISMGYCDFPTYAPPRKKGRYVLI